MGHKANTLTAEYRVNIGCLSALGEVGGEGKKSDMGALNG